MKEMILAGENVCSITRKRCDKLVICKYCLEVIERKINKNRKAIADIAKLWDTPEEDEA